MKKSILKNAGIMLAGILVMSLSGCAKPDTKPKLTDYLKVLPAGTDGTAGITAAYVEFGKWPQSVLKEDGKVTVDKTVSKEMGSFTCYKGSDGEWYVECAENACNNSTEYTDGTSVKQNGTTNRYFKVEPIKWVVLRDNYSGKKLLLAENILTGNVPYYDYSYSATERTIGAETKICSNNYMYSQVRAYLNGLSYYDDSNSAVDTYSGKGFLQTAFESTAQGFIADAQVDNSKKTTNDKDSNEYACKDTTDKIFLLSYREVHDYVHGSHHDRKVTDFAKANKAYQSSIEGEGGLWWTRSPVVQDYDGVSMVTQQNITTNTSSNDSDCGVVPALCVSF